MRTEFLSDWERVAIEEAVAAFLPRLEGRAGEALLKKLREAEQIRLTYPNKSA